MAKAPCGCEVYGTPDNPAIGVYWHCNEALRLYREGDATYAAHLDAARAAVREAEERKP